MSFFSSFIIERICGAMNCMTSDVKIIGQGQQRVCGANNMALFISQQRSIVRAMHGFAINIGIRQSSKSRAGIMSTNLQIMVV